MIILKNTSNGKECVVTPTIFPDRTSQVWKLPDDIVNNGWYQHFDIYWRFESEAELIQLLQLRDLVLAARGKINRLVIPYMPYARQDKEIRNSNTFALITFLSLISGYFDESSIECFDLHSGEIFSREIGEGRGKIHKAEKHILKALVASQADLICYPDASAAKRYNVPFDHIIANKKRNQATGEIEGHELLPHNYDLKDKTVICIDDILDGAATFISIGKMLKDEEIKALDVYTSHGIFSKGVHLPKELGKIRHFYTTDSYLPSQEMLQKHGQDVTVYKLDI